MNKNIWHFINYKIMDDVLEKVILQNLDFQNLLHNFQ